MSDKINELREEFADYAHTAWSGWWHYLFGESILDKSTGKLTIPQWAVDRWELQAKTPYSDLTNTEKDSDREEANKILAILWRGEPRIDDTWLLVRLRQMGMQSLNSDDFVELERLLEQLAKTRHLLSPNDPCGGGS